MAGPWITLYARCVYAEVFFTIGVGVVIVLVLYAVNLCEFGRLAGWLFVLLLILITTLDDDPELVIHLRGLIMFSLPIFLSSPMLGSWASFPIAALSSLTLSGLSYQAGGFGPVHFGREGDRRFLVRDCPIATR